jgi:hypothetical protein
VPVAATPDGAVGAARASAAGVQASPSSLTLANPRLHSDAQSSEPQDAAALLCFFSASGRRAWGRPSSSRWSWKGGSGRLAGLTSG